MVPDALGCATAEAARETLLTSVRSSFPESSFRGGGFAGLTRHPADGAGAEPLSRVVRRRDGTHGEWESGRRAGDRADNPAFFPAHRQEHTMRMRKTAILFASAALALGGISLV